MDPVSLQCDVITQGVLRSTVPDPVKSMLTAMLESALRCGKDERHRYQEGVVSMLQDALQGVQHDIEKTIAEKQEHLAGSDKIRSERQAAVKAAEEDLEDKKKATDLCKYALADDAQAFKNAKEAVAEAQAAQKRAEKEFEALVKHKDRLQSTVSDFVRPLVEGTATGDDAHRLAESLMVSLSKLGLDESMMTAIPEAITKEPSARGSFDASVVSGLQEELEKRLASDSNDISAAEPAKDQCAAGLKAAEATFEAAKEKQHGGAEAYNNARAAQKDSEASLKLAIQVLNNLEPEIKKIQKELAAAQKDLDEFCSGAKHAFAELRDRVVLEAPKETEATEEAAEEEPAAEAAADVAMVSEGQTQEE